MSRLTRVGLYGGLAYAVIVGAATLVVFILPSTALEGSVSRIVATHPEGSIITVPRYYADIVITEYGVARLLGKNHRERTRELIAIAHPDHRAELSEAAQRLF